MKIKLLQLVVFVLCATLSLGCADYSQTGPKVEWVKTWGGDKHQTIPQMAIDYEGNVYVVALTIENREYSLICCSPDGESFWEWEFDESVRAVRDIKVDPEGSLYILLDYEGTIDANPGPEEWFVTCEINTGVCLVKFNNNLNLEFCLNWGVNFEEIGWEFVSGDDIALDHDGNIFLAGGFAGEVDFNPGPDEELNNAEKNEAFICKLANDGSFVWVRTQAGYESQVHKSDNIHLDSAGNIYFQKCLAYTNSVDVDMGDDEYLIDADGITTVICKYSNDGDLVWVKVQEGILPGEFVVEPGGTSFVAGVIYNKNAQEDSVEGDQADGQESALSIGVLYCYDSAGDLLWSQEWSEEESYTVVNSLGVDRSGTAQIAITNLGTERAGNESDYPTCMFYYSPDGSCLRTEQINHSGEFGIISICFDRSGNVYLSGYFEEEVDFLPDTENRIISTNLDSDAFLMKLSQ